MTEDRSETDVGRVSEVADARSSDSALLRLWSLLAPRKWQVLGLSLLLTVSAAMAQVTPQFVRIVIDELIPRGEAGPFVVLAVLMVAFYLVAAMVGYASMYYSYAFTQGVISDLRLRAYGRLLSLPITRFVRERSGSLVSRVVADVNALETMIQSGASRLVGQLFSIVVVMVILFIMQWQLALLSLIGVAGMGVITLLFQGPLRSSARRIRSQVGDLTATATEAIQNIGIVKMFANEQLEHGRFKSDNDRYVRLNLGRRKQVGWMEGLVELSSQLSVAALLLIGAWLIVGGDLTVGALSAFVLYLRNLIGPVMSVMFFNNSLQAGMAALERVSDLLEAPAEVEGGTTEVPSSDIVFSGVTFSYPGTEQPALAGIDLQVPSGATVALAGPSGAGKSTITNLLCRLYDPAAGTIALGGIPLPEYRLSSLRRAVAVVPQDPALFSGTVADNVRYARPEADDDAVVAAARLANADTFIRSLPDAYQTEIGEKGVKLSGGQKQRIAIARALLKEARILVLDEATSSLDAESEAVIQDALSGMFKTRKSVTTVIIAHRLSTIRNADLIYVIDAGQVVETGSHRQLIAQGGLYRSLYDLQMREEPVAT